MSFDCEITFTGLCALVPRVEKGKIARVDWVLVNGSHKKAGDMMAGKYLRYHRAFLRFSLSDLKSANLKVPTETDGLLYLDRQRITFEGIVEDETLNLSNIEYSLPEMDCVVEKGCIDRATLRRRPPSKVASQVILSAGLFSPGARTGQTVRFLPRYPGIRTAYKPTVTSKVVVKLKATESLKVVGEHFGGRDTWCLELRPHKGKLKLAFANLPDHDPLEWTSAYGERKLEPDEDFRWFYKLLSRVDYKDVRDALKEAGELETPCPIPEPTQKGGDDNCIPVRFLPVPL